MEAVTSQAVIFIVEMNKQAISSNDTITYCFWNFYCARNSMFIFINNSNATWRLMSLPKKHSYQSNSRLPSTNDQALPVIILHFANMQNEACQIRGLLNKASAETYLVQIFLSLNHTNLLLLQNCCNVNILVWCSSLRLH